MPKPTAPHTPADVNAESPDSAPATTAKRSRGKLILKIGFSLALLAFLFANADLEATLAELSEANLWYIPVCVAIYLLGQMLSAWRWAILARANGFQLALREYFDYYMMGMFFSLFLPSAIGGDVGRMVYLAKAAGRKKREAFLTILAERGIGLVTLVLLTSAVMFSPMTRVLPTSLRAAIVGMFAVGAAAYAALHWLPIERLVARFPKLSLLGQAQIYWQNKPLLLRALGVSALCHLSMLVIHLLIARALGVSVPWLYLLATYGVVSLVSVLPVTFNGLGLREGAYQFLLVQYGLAPHTALAFGVYWFLISLCTSLLGGLIMVKGHYQTPDSAALDEAADEASDEAVAVA